MAKPIGPDLVFHLKLTGEPTLSPDGQTLIFTKSKIDPDTKEGHSKLIKMDLTSKEKTPFSQGPKDSTAQFSPDGRHVAFLRSDDKNRKQVWLMPSDGGEARQLTHSKGNITFITWAPDSQKLAFVADVDPDQLPDDHNPKNDPRTKVVTRLRYRFDTLGWVGNKHRHIFAIGINDEEAKQLTDGDWDDMAPTWSPDSSQIAFVSSRTEQRELEFCSEIYTVSASGGEVKLQSDGLHNSLAPCWSPDGKKLLCIGTSDPHVSAMWQGLLHILEPGQAPRALTDDSISPSSGFGPIVPAPEIRWKSDGSIYFLADAKGESFLFKTNETDGGMEKIMGGGSLINQISYDASGSKAIIVVTSPSTMAELFQLDLPAGEHTLLDSANESFFSEHPPARVEKFTQSRAGMDIESRLYFPPDFDESKKYPLVIDIHGGPHGVFYDSFVMWQQVLATNGFLVLGVNPRGSSTYGTDFLKAVLGDWGGEDYLDIMNAADEVCSRPYVDENRTGIHGYSYGGFMSSWIVGQTTRFKAAAVGAPCIDLPSFYGTSDIGIPFGEIQWGGTRFEAYEKYLKHSPLTYVENVETPVLLLHGEADHRCPIEQSEQYFVALKRLGKEVEFVRFPGCSHLFLRFAHPNLRQEYMQRLLDWFNKHLN